MFTANLLSKSSSVVPAVCAEFLDELVGWRSVTRVHVADNDGCVFGREFHDNNCSNCP